MALHKGRSATPMGRQCRPNLPSLHRHYPASSVLRTRPPPQVAQPGPHGPPVAGRARTAWGFPCCCGSPSADMPTPLPRWNPWSVSRREGLPPPVPRNGGLPRVATGSASTSGCFGACTAFTRVAACLLAEPPSGPLSRRLRRLRYLRRRSDSYRLERPVAGRESHPLKIRALLRRTATRPPILCCAWGSDERRV
jgi:hypothetical protein